MTNYKPRIGYACMNKDIQPNEYKTCRKDRIDNERLRTLILHNLSVLDKAIDYNIKNGNHMFRVTSSLIPFGSSSLNTLDWKDAFSHIFESIKSKIIDNDIRISVHPGQYTVINSPDENVIENSIAELKYHADLLELLSGNQSSKMILHVGGVYGDKPAAIKRFIDVYNHRLDETIKKYLVIENDDRLYTVEDVLSIANQIPIPVVFDNLHHEVNPSFSNMPLSDIVTLVKKTWRFEDGNIKMHYSQQDSNKRVGAHSETIYLDQFKIDYENIYSIAEADIMLEVKDKNRSFIKVQAYLNPNNVTMEKEWARYKYWVMARSQSTYDLLRLMFKDQKQVKPLEFYELVDSLRSSDVNLGAQVNAFQHAWGYFKKVATTSEKDKFLTMIETITVDNIRQIYRYLYKLAEKYEVRYLLDSYYFD